MIYAASARTSRAAVIPSICRNAIVDTFVVSCRVDSSWLCGFDQPLLLRCQRLSPKKYPLRGNSDLYQLFECFSCVDELDLHDGAEFHGDADFGLQLDADFLRRCARHAHKHLNFGDYYYYRRQFAKFTEDAVVEFLSGAAGNSKERILQIGEIDWLSPASILKMVNVSAAIWSLLCSCIWHAPCTEFAQNTEDNRLYLDLPQRSWRSSRPSQDISHL